MQQQQPKQYFRLSSLASRSLLFFLAFSVAIHAADGVAHPPTVGSKAPDFQLQDAVSGKKVRLSEVSGPVVLVVLRGYPGYQCPFCNRQVQDFLQKSSGFAAKGAHVVLVYPGPSSVSEKTLSMIAGEFLAGKTLPEGFQMLLDPDYAFTNQYGLRWEGSMETAYPSVFLLDRNGEVFFSRIVKSHGGRVAAQEIVDLLPSPRKPAGANGRQQP